METRTEDIEVDGRLTVATRPAAEGRWPGVVMLHEAWGIDDVLRRQSARLASAGYLVYAPDLLGEGSKIRCMMQATRALQAGRGRPFEVVEACRSKLAADPACTGRVGVIGFCMGGGFALLLGPRGFDVSAVNYGMVPGDVDAALAGTCPVVDSYGGRDRPLGPKAAVLEAALERLDVPHDVKVYPEAGHSFLNDAQNAPLLFRPLMKVMGAGPEPASAADAWARIEVFFARYLGS